MSINFKQFFKPTKAFEEKNKARFLATFDVRYPVTARSRWIFVLKTVATTLAVIAIVFGGISAYADTTNVAVESPLYPLKRVAESVELAVTPPAAKPSLEATFATRRATEITELENNHPTSTLLPGLSADLGNDLNASVSVGLTTNRCNILRGVVDASSSFVRNALYGHVGALVRLREQCGYISGSGSSSTSTTTSTLPAIFRNHYRGLGGYFLASSTASGSMNSSITASSGASISTGSSSVNIHVHTRIPNVVPPLIYGNPPVKILP